MTRVLGALFQELGGRERCIHFLSHIGEMILLFKLFKLCSLETPGLYMSTVLDLVTFGAEKLSIGMLLYKLAVKAQLAPCPSTSGVD